MNVRFALFLLIALASTTAIANEKSCQKESATKIFFGNGVGNTFANARASLEHLRLGVDEKLQNNFPDEKFYYDIAYNFTDGVLTDLTEVYLRKLAEEGADFRQIAVSLFVFGLRNLPRESLGVPEKYYNFHDDVWLNMHLKSVEGFEESDTYTQKIQYLKELRKGRKVLVVAHSQGNLFANSIAENFYETYGDFYEQSFRIVGVASPAAKVVGENEYITAHDDIVINLLRPSFPVLKSNIDNDPGIFTFIRDASNHEFIRSYYSEPLKSKGNIDTKIIHAITTSNSPASDYENYAITARVSSRDEDNQNNVSNIHVDEPGSVLLMDVSGKYHRWEGNPTGDVGGVANNVYTVDCNNIKVGEYFFHTGRYNDQSYGSEIVFVTAGDGQTHPVLVGGRSARTFSGYQGALKAKLVVAKDPVSGEFAYFFE